MLRIDRLTIAADRLAALIDSVPPDRIREALPDWLKLADRALRLARMDLIAEARTTSTDLLRRLPGQAGQSQEAANAWLQHVIALVAWLDGQTDREPPLLASAPAIGSPSSADPAPESQRSYGG